MKKSYLHNYTGINLGEKDYITKIKHKNNVKNVDINKLLNRVKINEKNEIKEKIILLTLFLLLISTLAVFLAF